MKIKVQLSNSCDACGKPVTETGEMLCMVCRATVRARRAIERAKLFKHKFWSLKEVTQWMYTTSSHQNY